MLDILKTEWREFLGLLAICVMLIVTFLLVSALAPGDAAALGSITPGSYNNWAAHNVIASNYGGWCGKRLSRVCYVPKNTAHCGPVWPGTDGFRHCTGSFWELSLGIKWNCKWRGGIFRANPKRVATILPVAPCVASGHL